jgi:hypothetical protein
MRLANIHLKWEKTELLTGMAFHPAFVLDCAPSTVSFAAGMYTYSVSANGAVVTNKFVKK